MTDTVVFSVRMPAKLKARLEAVADDMERPQSWVVNHAIEQFVEEQVWQVQAIEEGMAAADRGETVDHAEIIAKWERRLAGRLDEAGR